MHIDLPMLKLKYIVAIINIVEFRTTILHM